MQRICLYRGIHLIDTVHPYLFNAEKTMDLTAIPFGTTDWSTLEPVMHPGETGSAYWRTCQFGSTRVRMVEYSAGYLADHWCWRGHILLCLERERTPSWRMAGSSR